MSAATKLALGLTLLPLGLTLPPLVGCSSAVPHATQAAAHKSQLTVARLSQGRTRYIDKCSGCHSLFVPAKFSPGQWASKVEEMAVQARLVGDDQALILDYLQAHAAGS